MSFSFAHVTGTTRLDDHLLRVHFEVPDLRRLSLPGLPDEAVGIYFPGIGENAPPAMESRDGVWGYHNGPAPEARNYSIRHVDHAAGTIVVDFVVHSHGPATLWAQQAAPGQSVALSHARGWYRPPADAAWLLLVADLAGLPAAARILDGHRTTSGPPVTLIAEVIDDDLSYLRDLDGVTVIPLVGSGNGYGPSRLAETVADLRLPEGIGYCWFAGEASQSRAVRKLLRRELHWSAEHYDIIGYWRFDGEAWSRRYAEHGDELFAIYQQAIADGKSEKQAAEEFDEALERAGL